MEMKDKSNWVIKLPVKAKVLVKIGDKVEVGDKLATFNSHKVEVFDYSGSLSLMSENKRQELNDFFKEKVVKKDELFCNIGIFKNQICFPLTGLCLGFDEFKNLRIEQIEDEEKEIISPIEAKVSKIEDGKMILEFKAKEYLGEGLNGFKAWSDGEVKIIDDIKFLNHDLEDKVLFTKNFERAFLLKAQAIGVVGIVILDNEELKEVDIDLPVLKLKEQEWNHFIKDNLGKNKKMLINAKADKLLLVLE